MPSRRRTPTFPAATSRRRTRELALRTAGRLTDARGFDDLVVRTVDGVPIRVRDLGRAEDGTAEQRTDARLNGRPTVTLEVIRQSDANTVAVIEGVKAILAQLRAELPADVSTDVIRDQSSYIYAGLHEINIHLILGSILASIVVLVFMRSWRSTLIAAVAIPTSVISTFGVMYALGFTLNSITMLALVLMVGVVIDDAIVVLENIFRFVEEKGMDAREAARARHRRDRPRGHGDDAQSRRDLRAGVVHVERRRALSLPVRHHGGGRGDGEPLRLVHADADDGVADAATGGRRGTHASSREGFYAWLDERYTRLIRWSMAHRATRDDHRRLSSRSLSVPFYMAVGREFVPTDVDEAEFNVSITAPEGTSLAR